MNSVFEVWATGGGLTLTFADTCRRVSRFHTFIQNFFFLCIYLDGLDSGHTQLAGTSLASRSAMNIFHGIFRNQQEMTKYTKLYTFEAMTLEQRLLTSQLF